MTSQDVCREKGPWCCCCCPWRDSGGHFYLSSQPVGGKIISVSSYVLGLFGWNSQRTLASGSSFLLGFSYRFSFAEGSRQHLLKHVEVKGNVSVNDPKKGSNSEGILTWGHLSSSLDPASWITRHTHICPFVKFYNNSMIQSKQFPE